MVKRVLVGIDFSDASKKAFASAYEWAKKLDLPLTAVHVLQPPAPGVGGAPGVISFPLNAPHVPEAQGAKWDIKWKDEVEAHVVDHLKAWAKDYPGTTLKVVWGGPAEGLLAEADVDTLIVLGSFGHSRLEHILFGSTAVKVVRHAPGDVLVIRAPQS